jgi:hypothetical protein
MRAPALAALALAVIVTRVPGGAMAPLAMPMQVATSDAVFVGKVTEAPGKPVPGGIAGDARQITLARVSVSACYLGGAGKNVEVAAFSPAYRSSPPALEKGVEYLFLVKRHPKRKDTFVAASIYDVHRAGPGLKALVDEAKGVCALLADPMKSLKGKDRARAAALLLLRYKTTPLGEKPGTEPVPAEESRLILSSLAEADWKGGDWMTSPRQAFARLGLGPRDGWKVPEDAAAFDVAARKWLKENAGKYKLTRYARGEGGPAIEP